MDISLNEITLFSRMPEKALAEVYLALKTRQLNTKEILFNQGDTGEELIIVKEGKIAIFVPLQGKPTEGQPIRLFQAGDVLGEMALIDRKPRSASARAEEPTVILTLSGDEFRRLLTASDELAFSVMAGLSDRIRYTTDFLGEVRTWVGKMAEGNYQNTGIRDSSQYKDKTLAMLAEEFARMAAQVKEREDQLRREVAQLRIEVDEAKRKQEVSDIVGSDYYRQLKEKLKVLRQQNEEQS